MGNYAPNLPRDKGGEPKQDYSPPITAKARTNKENATVSSILYLGHNTTELEVSAVNQHVALRWFTQGTIDSSVVTGSSVQTAVGSENWDNVVQKDTVRRFVIPIATANVNPGSVQGVNRAEGLYTAIGYKTLAGNGSVLTTEY